ncbi:MAG TPA: hypothetical protein PKA88_18090, partial [Polyangiaceae bacterium]|nr:hypothetical protein [Polyangiaceae bacterium]
MARPAAIPAVLSVLLLACGPKPPASSASETPTPGAESEVPSPPAPGENPAGAAPGEQPVVAVPAGKYRVSLSRPEVVGERAQMTRTVSDLTSQRIVEGGKVVKNETMRQHVEFEAVKETLAITPAGHPRRTRYTVQRFEARMGKSMKPIFASGTVLTAQRGSEA